VHIMYVDESGDLGAMPASPAPTGNDQPVLVIGALLVSVSKLDDLTQDFLALKSQFFPSLHNPSGNHLDIILPEIKGADLRRSAIKGGRRASRHAIGFLDKLIAMLVKHDVKLLARIWVKDLGQPFNGRSVYTSSIQSLYTSFDKYLNENESFGFCIADSRDYLKNVNVAHSVFTQKFRASTGVYERILELPTFAHSENHAGIQICDMICSALLYPIACHAYCTGYVSNTHVQADAVKLKTRFGHSLKALQYRYCAPLGRWHGGVTVSDPLGKRGSRHMLQ